MMLPCSTEKILFYTAIPLINYGFSPQAQRIPILPQDKGWRVSLTCQQSKKRESRAGVKQRTSATLPAATTQRPTGSRLPRPLPLEISTPGPPNRVQSYRSSCRRHRDAALCSRRWGSWWRRSSCCGEGRWTGSRRRTRRTTTSLRSPSSSSSSPQFASSSTASSSRFVGKKAVLGRSPSSLFNQGY
jgi:hypothetical protein